ncbi:MAG: DUF368 domain-containing protein [Actinomycetota bacterium]
MTSTRSEPAAGERVPMRPVDYGLQLGRGFAMGAADIVPGVSGGTVALVVGIYDRLIANVRTGARGLKQVLTGDGSGFVATLRRIEWAWLVSLLVGIVLAIGLLSSVLERLLDDEAIAMSGLFLGLVVGTILVAWNMLDRDDPSGRRIDVAIMVAIGATMFLLLGLRSDTEVADGAEEVVTRPFWVFFLAGAIAICAMILPGISGSFILVMLGMYTEVLGAVNDRDLVVLLAFVAGCVVGLAAFSTLLNHLLEQYRSHVIAAMIGLMLGSTRVLWPWPNGVHTTTLSAPADDVVLPIALALVGAAVVVVVERISTHRPPA